MNNKQLIVALAIVMSLVYIINTGLAQHDLEVTGILGGEELSAIVNGKIVKVGDEIEGAKILEIKKDSVKFKHGDRVFTKKIGKVFRKSSPHSSYKEKVIKAIMDTWEKIRKRKSIGLSKK